MKQSRYISKTVKYFMATDENSKDYPGLALFLRCLIYGGLTYMLFHTLFLK